MWFGVAAGKQADEGEADLVRLAEHDGIDLVYRAGEGVAQVGAQRRMGGFVHAAP